MQRARAGENGYFLSLVEDFGSALNIVLVGNARTAGPRVRHVPRLVALGALAVTKGLLLQIDRHGYMCHAAIRKCSADRQLDDVLDVRRSHDALVVYAGIDEQLIGLDVLLRQGTDQVVEL